MGRPRRGRLAVPPVATAAALALCVLAAACTGREQPPEPSPSEPPPSATAHPTATGAPSSQGPPPSEPMSPPSVVPDSPTTSGVAAGPPRFRAAAAMADVRVLAGSIGPRLATGPAYRRAGRMVQRRFGALGYDVRRERFRVPAGDSWGVPVESGRSFNVVAAPHGFQPSRPHVVLGAHLDTVAVSPGAEDNASGIAVLLETARLAAQHGVRLPAVFVAFGAEEPRGQGDDMHHFGSQRHVRRMPMPRREALQAMVSLDRVGVGGIVPVCTGPLSPPRVQRELVRAAGRVAVPVRRCANTASDHWSFEKAEHAVARLGSTSYAAYHSAQDRPGVVNPRQLGRTGRVAWEWLR